MPNLCGASSNSLGEHLDNFFETLARIPSPNPSLRAHVGRGKPQPRYGLSQILLANSSNFVQDAPPLCICTKILLIIRSILVFDMTFPPAAMQDLASPKNLDDQSGQIYSIVNY